MLSKAEKYLQLLQNKTKTHMPFPQSDNQSRESTIIVQSDIILPSQYQFRSSQQIQNYKSDAHQITHQTNNIMHNNDKSFPNKWPQSSIGLVLCEHMQNNNILYVYGTGILIHMNIVLTSAQNIYCRRLNKQYINIRFLTGVNGNKCSGIFDVKRVHYQKEYIMQQYENYNFAVLQLYGDLSDNCGYVGWMTGVKPAENKFVIYGYMNDNQQASFNLRQISKNQHREGCSGSGVLIKERDKYYLTGLNNRSSIKEFSVLNKKMRDIVNEWTKITQFDLNYKVRNDQCEFLVNYIPQDFNQINLGYNYIDSQGFRHLSQANWPHLNAINLTLNTIKAQGCKYLSQANWRNLTKIDLNHNNIGSQGCKYLSEANWIHLTKLYLDSNYIDAQGCKYLNQARWKHLNIVTLWSNIIDSYGCKYLTEDNWIHLKQINLSRNNLGDQGCKHLNQSNWKYLKKIQLSNNNIDAEGCKYLSQANWVYLTIINLYYNRIGIQGCKYLRQANWIHLTAIDLSYNSVDVQGCKYLKQVNWEHLIKFKLMDSSIKNIINRISFQQLWPKARMQWIKYHVYQQQ